MARAFLIVMDSVGAGGAPDAAAFFNGKVPDTGANTLAHIAGACAAGRAEEGRGGPLRMPVLDALGLGRAVETASGTLPPGSGAGAAGQRRGPALPGGGAEVIGHADLVARRPSALRRRAERNRQQGTEGRDRRHRPVHLVLHHVSRAAGAP